MSDRDTAEKLTDGVVNVFLLHCREYPDMLERECGIEAIHALSGAPVRLTTAEGEFTIHVLCDGELERLRTAVEIVTVCDRCYQETCWQGKFYCTEFKEAGTVDIPRMLIGKIPTPTPWAYEQACRTLEKYRATSEDLAKRLLATEQQVARLWAEERTRLERRIAKLERRNGELVEALVSAWRALQEVDHGCKCVPGGFVCAMHEIEYILPPTALDQTALDAANAKEEEK